LCLVLFQGCLFLGMKNPISISNKISLYYLTTPFDTSYGT
jgi:hypothetical protein